MAVQHDAVTQMLATQVEEGIKQIDAANEILLSADNEETGDRAIDKAFKDEKVEDKESLKAFKAAQDLREKYREAVAAYRNAYRKNVLGEEEKAATPEVDMDTLKETRKMILEALKLAQTYAKANGKKDVLAWAESINVPQVGRKGSASVSGVKKPRAFVKFDGNTYDSFGEAAKALSVSLSTDDNKVSFTSPDLVQAWSDAGEADSFDFHGVTVEVVLKNKDKAAA